ncbi:MAG: hypothetical protein CTY34_12545 [Methylobacter sp.]|nr:MAG: hypothetical protein CTY34_12545 [Methylobacter sp.]PPD23934.1 MAG: hypothetical protein CTY24_02650 [Methylobacter sp.]
MKTKEDYIDQLSAEFKVWSADIDALTIKAETAVADVKDKCHKDIELLRAKQAVAQEKIKELQDASGDAWESVKDTAENIWADFRTGIASVKAKFK